MSKTRASRSSAGRGTWRLSPDEARGRGRAANGRGPSGRGRRGRDVPCEQAKRLAPRIVPEDLAQIARQARGDLLEQGERGLDVAPREGRLPWRAGEARAGLECPPGVLLLADARPPHAPSNGLRARSSSRRERERAPHEERERLVLWKPPVPSLSSSAWSSRESDLDAGDVRGLEAAARACLRAAPPQPRGRALRPRHRRTSRRGAHRRDRPCASRARPRARGAARARRRRSSRCRRGARWSARARIAAEVEIDVREVEQRLLHRVRRARAATHVDGGLEVPERRARSPSPCAMPARFRRVVAASRRGRWPRRARPRRLARLRRAAVALVHDGERAEAERPARAVHALGELHGRREAAPRALVAGEACATPSAARASAASASSPFAGGAPAASRASSPARSSCADARACAGRLPARCRAPPRAPPPRVERLRPRARRSRAGSCAREGEAAPPRRRCSSGAPSAPATASAPSSARRGAEIPSSLDRGERRHARRDRSSAISSISSIGRRRARRAAAPTTAACRASPATRSPGDGERSASDGMARPHEVHRDASSSGGTSKTAVALRRERADASSSPRHEPRAALRRALQRGPRVVVQARRVVDEDEEAGDGASMPPHTPSSRSTTPRRSRARRRLPRALAPPRRARR